MRYHADIVRIQDVVALPELSSVGQCRYCAAWPPHTLGVLGVLKAGGSRGRADAMPKYLIQASYTADGIQGLLKDSGSKRKAAAEQAIKGLGGSIEAFYFAFGDADGVVIVDAPTRARPRYPSR